MTPVQEANIKEILHKGIGPSPEDLDPQIATGLTERKILIALFEGLVNPDPIHLEPIPGVAERWEVSDDGKVYTFYIRPNARWSNGDDVTADDFLFAYQRILSPRLGAGYASMLYVIKAAEAYHKAELDNFDAVGIKALDRNILQIELENPVPYFLSLLTHHAWYPVNPATILTHRASERRGTGWTRPDNFVGNGPFVLKKWAQSDLIVVEKNESYWNADAVKLKEIRFYPMDVETEERAFRGGQLHITEAVPMAKVNTYIREKSPYLQTSRALGTYYYILNATKPPLNDVRVRKALSMAIDRNAIARQVVGEGKEGAYALTPPETAGYKCEAQLQEDVVSAKELLAQAGYPNGGGFPEIEILYNTSDSNKSVAMAIQEMWKKNLGIEVKLANQEWKVCLDRRRKKDYDVLRGSWFGDYLDPSSFLDVYKSNSSNNHSGWSHTRYDELLKMAMHETNPQKRYDYFQEAEAILLDELPMIPIYFYNNTYLMQPSVKGWFPNLLDIHPYKGVYLEHDL